MKVTVLNKKKPTQSGSSIYSSIFLFVLGIILVFNSGGFISTIFTILGAVAILFGIVRFFRYYQLKNQFHVEQSEILISAVSITFVGLLVVFLSNFIVNTIQIVTGIWLLFVGISKMNQGISIKNVNQKLYITNCLSSIILIFLGIYTIVADNVVFVFIGIILVLYAGADLARHFFQKSN